MNRARSTITGLAMAAAIAGASVAVASMATLIGERSTARAETILQGQGCDGASGPIYATEEDAFPYCQHIARIPLSSIKGR